MPDYTIITDAAADLTPAMIQEFNIKVLPMSITVGETTFSHYPDEREMKIKDFYARIRTGASATTAAIPPSAWSDLFEEELAIGNDILAVPFSSGLSSSCSNAILAADSLREKYPSRRIELVDSLSATCGQVLLTRFACMNRAAGLDIDANKKFLEEQRYKICHWFTVDDLGHLRRGGRISATTAVVGQTLGIKPILHVDNEGHLIKADTARGRKNSLKALVSHMEKTAIAPESQEVFVFHGDSSPDAEEVAAELKKKLNVKNAITGYVGPVSGAHAGPGVVVIAFVGSER